MENSAVGVLKKDTVRIVESPKPAAPSAVQQPVTGEAGPSVRIVDVNGQAAIIEISCECGKKITLHCELSPQGA